MHAVLLIVTAASAHARIANSAAGLLERDEQFSLKERPVAKVVRMLKDMQAELNKEMEDDKAVYEMISCWCKTNDQEKTKAIEEGEAKSAQLLAEMDETAAKIIETKEKIKETKDEINKDFDTLNQANAMRMKENKEFHGEETELLGAIQACEQAIVVLSEHHPALTQIHSAATGLKKALPVQLLSGVLDQTKLTFLKAFVTQAASANSFLAIPGMQSYAPASGQIFGILKQLKEDLSSNLSESQKAEQKALEEYESLKAAKEEELATGKKLLAQLEEQLANLGDSHAQAVEEYEDTQEQLKLDKTFLANLKKQCSATDEEYEERVKSRLEEIAAVSDTIEFLNSDEAYEMFDKTVNTAFLQRKSVSIASQKEKKLRSKALAVLAHAAGTSHSPQLGLIMVSVRLDAFDKVKAAIDKMVAELKAQQADEVTKRDWCTDELNKNNLTMEAKYDLQSNLQTKIADLEKAIEVMTKDMETKKNEISDMQTEMKRASEDREAENSDYQQAVSDQRITQMILDKALQRMKQVYSMMQAKKAPGAPHIQTSATDTDPGNGPARFKKMEKNAGGGKVVAMIEGIITDSKQLEAEAIAAEQDGQTAYENFMKESNDSITKLTEQINNLKENKAKAEEELEMAKVDLDQTNTELQGLHDESTDLHQSCDYLLKNFFVRQEARQAEIDALNEAKAILSGMQ